MRIAYVISDNNDNFAWYAYNDEDTLHSQIGNDFDGTPDIEIMSVEEAKDMGMDDIPDIVAPGEVNKFYYGS